MLHIIPKYTTHLIFSLALRNNMKPVVIIVISVVCSVIAVLAVQFLSSGEDIGESIGNIVPFDCAKGWDKLRDHYWLRGSDEFKELSFEEKYPIRKDEAINIYQFNKNLCYSNHEEWQDRAQDKDGRLVEIDQGNCPVCWYDAIDSEFEYNTKFPEGHWLE